MSQNTLSKYQNILLFVAISVVSHSGYTAHNRSLFITASYGADDHFPWSSQSRKVDHGQLLVTEFKIAEHTVMKTRATTEKEPGQLYCIKMIYVKDKLQQVDLKLE